MDKHEFENIKKKLRLTNQGVSDVMGVRLRTVTNWAEGIWEMPLMAEKFLRILISVKRDKDVLHKVRYEAGNGGCHLCAASGYIRGHEEGHRTGYAEGYSTARVTMGIG